MKSRMKETLEEYLLRSRLESMCAKLEPILNGFQVRTVSENPLYGTKVIIAGNRILGTGKTQEEALSEASFALDEESLAQDKPTVALDKLDEECLMPLQEWQECVECGGFIDSDGSGNPATSTHRGNAGLYPSYAKAKRPIPTWATHVCWYNK